MQINLFINIVHIPVVVCQAYEPTLRWWWFYVFYRHDVQRVISVEQYFQLNEFPRLVIQPLERFQEPNVNRNMEK